MQAQSIRAFKFEASGHYGYAYQDRYDPAEVEEHEELLTFKGVVYAKNEERAERFIRRTDFHTEWEGSIEEIKLEEYDEDPDEIDFYGEGVVDYNESY